MCVCLLMRLFGEQVNLKTVPQMGHSEGVACCVPDLVGTNCEITRDNMILSSTVPQKYKHEPQIRAVYVILNFLLTILKKKKG